MKPSHDQPLGGARPPAVSLILQQRRTAGHGPVAPSFATALVSPDLWPALVAWLKTEAPEVAGYRCIQDDTLPPCTVRLTLQT